MGLPVDESMVKDEARRLCSARDNHDLPLIHDQAAFELFSLQHCPDIALRSNKSTRRKSATNMSKARKCKSVDLTIDTTRSRLAPEKNVPDALTVFETFFPASAPLSLADPPADLQYPVLGLSSGFGVDSSNLSGQLAPFTSTTSPLDQVFPSHIGTPMLSSPLTSPTFPTMGSHAPFSFISTMSATESFNPADSCHSRNPSTGSDSSWSSLPIISDSTAASSVRNSMIQPPQSVMPPPSIDEARQALDTFGRFVDFQSNGTVDPHDHQLVSKWMQLVRQQDDARMSL